MKLNRAMVLMKPLANTPLVEAVVRERFAEEHIDVVSDGTITGAALDATTLAGSPKGEYSVNAVADPAQLDLSDAALASFCDTFHVAWHNALRDGEVVNVTTAIEMMGIEPSMLNTVWSRNVERATVLEGGICVTRLYEPACEKIVVGCYVPTLLSRHHAEPGATLRYMIVEWDEAVLPWAKFLADVVGTTNAVGASAGETLRGRLFFEWERHGMAFQPHYPDHSLHASRSPIEALAEQRHWLGRHVSEDPFGQALLGACAPMRPASRLAAIRSAERTSGRLPEPLQTWIENGAVEIGGRVASALEHFAEKDASYVLFQATRYAAEITTPSASAAPASGSASSAVGAVAAADELARRASAPPRIGGAPPTAVARIAAGTDAGGGGTAAKGAPVSAPAEAGATAEA
jgi:hypothetical protein